MAPRILKARVSAIRRFNRFYTRQIGALDERHLHTELSLSEARILYEIAHGNPATAAQIAEALFLDRGYLSRVISSFARRGLIRKKASATDKRESDLTLTPKGRDLFRELDSSATRDVESMVSRLVPAAQAKLVHAMSEIETVLGPPTDKSPRILVRHHGPGDIGWIVQRHAQIYTEEYGWNERFEALVAEIASIFLRDQARVRAMLDRRGGRRECRMRVASQAL